MPSLKAIRKRITSVRNTQKITRAMKLVAAAKLRRAQEAIIATRPYARSLERVIAELADKADRDSHPLLARRDTENVSIVLLTSDRGLAGAFNTNVMRRGEGLIREQQENELGFALRAVGRKANDYFRRRDVALESYDAAPTSATALEFSHKLSNLLTEDYLEERVDRVVLVYNEFRSAISQGVVVKELFPINPQMPEGQEQYDGDYLYEPSKDELLNHLMPLYIQNSIYNAALESIASEFGARMTAMENATRNAGEMIDKLTLQFNRARQQAITKELLEIISGAEALKG
jgi:F-type H+-transporting ATPase subunit gamma